MKQLNRQLAEKSIIKKWNRKWKLELIGSSNPLWVDLYEKFTA